VWPLVIAAAEQPDLPTALQVAVLGAQHVASGAVAVVIIEAARSAWRHAPRVRVHLEVVRREVGKTVRRDVEKMEGL